LSGAACRLAERRPGTADSTKPAREPRAMQNAGFWQRCLATVIDSIIVGTLFQILEGLSARWIALSPGDRHGCDDNHPIVTTQGQIRTPALPLMRNVACHLDWRRFLSAPHRMGPVDCW
jgi:hypothetical protein